MKPRFFHYPKCSACRKAAAFLERHGVDVQRVDIVEQPPSKKELKEALRASGLPIKRLFNTSGQSYREGGFGERLATMSEADALAALAADGKLIKRPLLFGDGFVLIGFDDAAYAEHFAG